MDNKNIRGILGLVVVALLAFGVILGTKAITGGNTVDGGENGQKSERKGEELDVSGAAGIEKAVRLKKGGYETVIKTKGYGGDITMAVDFGEDRKTVESVAVLEQTETEGLGARITEEEFLTQFSGLKAPIYVASRGTADNENGAAGEETNKDEQKALAELEGAVLTDGTFEAAGQPDDSGFTDHVSITVSDGKITAVSWDALTEDGTSKAKMSEEGEYVMTEEGLSWKTQAEALAAALVENQSLSALPVDEQGKTDAVAGVSISIGGFLDLAQTCLREAAGLPAEEQNETQKENQSEGAEEENGMDAEKTVKESGRTHNQIDGISGATISSAAVARGINLAYEFLQEAENK